MRLNRTEVLVFALFVLMTVLISGPVGVLAQAAKSGSVDWKEAVAKDFDSSEELAGRPIYNDWESPKYLTGKPLLFFFFWSVEDKGSSDEKVAAQAQKTEKMNEILKSDSVVEQSGKFACIKVDLRALLQWGSKGEALANKYGVREAPALVFFDKTGFPQGDISGSTSEAALAEKLKFVGGIGSSGSGDCWVTADALDFKDRKHLKQRAIFEDWLQARELGEAKPMILFFFWPVKDATDKDASKDAKNQANKTREMEQALSGGAVPEQLARFYCFKVNLKELKAFGEHGEAYLWKYKVKSAPVLVVFDYKGGKMISISGTQKSDSLAKKLKSAADKSEKLLKK